MEIKKTAFWIWWKEYGKHLEAILIIGLLIITWYAYSNNRKVQEEIKENCGWGDEDYFCMCEKSEVMELKNKMNQVNLSIPKIDNEEKVELYIRLEDWNETNPKIYKNKDGYGSGFKEVNSNV